MSNQGYGKGELPGADRRGPQPEDTAAAQQANIEESYSYSRLDGPIHAERQMRVICIGLGGLGTVFRLQPATIFHQLLSYCL